MTPTVDWNIVTFEEGPVTIRAAFPSVVLSPDVIWEAHHACSPTTSWLDGHAVASDMDVVLDIVAINAPDECFVYDNFDLPNLRARAREAWDAGEVIFIEEGALIVPVADLTKDDIIAEALSRFRP